MDIAATGNGRRVVGYFVEWGIYPSHGTYLVTDIPVGKLTHVNYAFVGIDPATFQVEVYDPGASLEFIHPGEPSDTPFRGNLGMLRKLKLDHPQLKVLISFGGWTKSHGFHAAASTASSRGTSAANLVDFMVRYGLDGIDIDWEYPGVSRPADPSDLGDRGAPGGPGDKTNYTLFLKALRDRLDARGAADGRYYELTVAVGAAWDKIELTDPGEYSRYLDAINLMTYDFHGGFEPLVGHQAPLFANPHDSHRKLESERLNVDWVVGKFLALGVPASKLVLGVPLYSRGWDRVAGGWDADGDGKPDGMFGTGGPGLAGTWGLGGQTPFFELKQLFRKRGWESFRDGYSRAPWLYNREKGELYTFDDRLSISEKMDYVLEKGLGGAMFWELACDDRADGHELVDVIASKLLG